MFRYGKMVTVIVGYTYNRTKFLLNKEYCFSQVKLADVLAKVIIPINFLDHWPPRSLAIQFSTTQYIPWKTLDSIREGITEKKRLLSIVKKF